MIDLNYLNRLSNLSHFIEIIVGMLYERPLLRVPERRFREPRVRFVRASGRQVFAIEVESGRRTLATGIETFLKEFAGAATIRPLSVGSGGISVESFLAMSLADFPV